MANFPSSKRRRAACLDGGMVVRSGDDVATEEGLGNADGVAESEWQLVANRITSEDVEDLLLCAQRDAELMQGRDSSEACGVSQTSFLNSFEERQGREISNATLSQAQRGRVQQMVEEFLVAQHDTCAVRDVGGLLWDVLNELEDHGCCRPRPTTGGKSIFPLPVSGHPMVMRPGAESLRLLAACLNSMHGVPSSNRGRPSSLRVMKRLQGIVGASRILDEPLGDWNFSQLFTVKGVDYQGEEIRLARKVTWESIEPSLPQQVGMLDLREFCNAGVLHYVNHFAEFLLPAPDQVLGKPPRVFVDDADWERLARGLLERGLCVRCRVADLHHVGHAPLLNGLFAVSKEEYKEEVELCRLIMNLKPLNSITRPLEGDTCTLPMVTQLSALYLDDHELLTVSSEDLRCYFYLFAVPEAWYKFMGFGRTLPKSLVPDGEADESWVLCSRVLPMGFLNSVAIAQHCHRNVVRRSMGSMYPPRGGEGELRRDRPFSHKAELFRVYLDNFDELKKLDRRTYDLIQRGPSSVAEHLREAYASCGLPTHPKKTVEQSLHAEVQGAWIDGDRGTMSAKPGKIAKYVRLTLELLRQGCASQKELQVVCGGLVYAAMFKRPLLGALNQVWHAIVQMEDLPKGRKAPLSREVMAELTRFLGLIPLAFSDFRVKFDEMVSVSDASTGGGGFCISKGLTPYGAVAALSHVRGDIPEQHDLCQVLSIGLFDGISALRVALDLIRAPMAGHVSVECNPQAQRVVEANFPDSILVNQVEDVTEEMVLEWSLKFSNVGLIVVGSGPPCQGVSGLNADRRGALRDARSSLFSHVPRIVGLCFSLGPGKESLGKRGINGCPRL